MELIKEAEEWVDEKYPCRICKHKDIIGVIGCYCTKNFFQVVVENIKINLRKKNKIVNVISSCT